MTKLKSALIVGGGPLDSAQLETELSRQPDFIIGVDRGGGYLLGLGIYPQMLVGDFDSLSSDQLDLMNKAKVAIKKYPVKKDQTDLELALDLALEMNPGMIRILGGLGGRIDHTLGNISLLLKTLRYNIETHLLDEKHDLMVTDKKICLQKRAGWAVSLLPLTEAVHGVITSGLMYPLTGESLFFNNTRGIHNEFLADNAIIEIKEGILLVICFRE